MKFWKVCKHFYINQDKPTYDVLPYKFLWYLRCCWKWYGFKGLKWCYLFKWQANRKAKKLNNEVNK